MTPRDAAIEVFGPAAVANYEAVKSFYTKLGRAYEQAFAHRVGGRLGRNGEADVVTRLGAWEFCAAANTKNSAGEAAQLARVGNGRIVQVSGVMRPGHISAVEFLRAHGIADPYSAAHECELAAVNIARAQQLALKV